MIPPPLKGLARGPAEMRELPGGRIKPGKYMIKKPKENKRMRTYKIFIDGMYVGTEEFSAEEVRALNNTEGIVLILA